MSEVPLYSPGHRVKLPTTGIHEATDIDPQALRYAPPLTLMHTPTHRVTCHAVVEARTGY